MQQKLIIALGYNFKNFEFNQSNVELFERQVESDRSSLERGEISLTDFAQSESSLVGANAKLITASNELISDKKNFEKIIGSRAPEEIDLSFFPKLNTNKFKIANLFQNKLIHD